MSRSISTSNERPGATDSLEHATDALARGRPILIHDFADREGETDFVYPASSVDVDAVVRLRNDAGGLICVALADEVADEFDLPFLQDLLDHPVAETGHLGYDERSSFSLTVNHRETLTGITDSDRAKTIATLGRIADSPAMHDFSDVFRAPGHVHLLRAAPDLLSDRQGHTELCISLAKFAGIPPAMVVCEMLDDSTGEALSKGRAKAYAHRNGIPFVPGDSIVQEMS